MGKTAVNIAKGETRLHTLTFYTYQKQMKQEGDRKKNQIQKVITRQKYTSSIKMGTMINRMQRRQKVERERYDKDG